MKKELKKFEKFQIHSIQTLRGGGLIDDTIDKVNEVLDKVYKKLVAKPHDGCDCSSDLFPTN